MHVSKFAHRLFVFHLGKRSIEASFDAMLYMGRTFRNLVGVTVTSTHHNALGATSAARLRFELFWQVVVVLAIEDLIKGAFCENVQ